MVQLEAPPVCTISSPPLSHRSRASVAVSYGPSKSLSHAVLVHVDFDMRTATMHTPSSATADSDAVRPKAVIKVLTPYGTLKIHRRNDGHKRQGLPPISQISQSNYQDDVMPLEVKSTRRQTCIQQSVQYSVVWRGKQGRTINHQVGPAGQCYDTAQ